MSDGPHRSLNMRRGWKKVAEIADNRASALEEIEEAADSALSADWRADVPEAVASAICEILGGQQDSLFRDQKVMQVEALRRNTAGQGLGQLVIECALHQLISKKSGTDVAVEAVAEALCIWSVRHNRQIEEHYCRDSTQRRGQNLRARIERGIGAASLKGLARQFLKLGGAAVPRTPPKRTGLDDGVRL